MEEKRLRTWGKGNGVQQRTRGWVDRVGRVSLTPYVLLSRCSPCFPGPSPGTALALPRVQTQVPCDVFLSFTSEFSWWKNSDPFLQLAFPSQRLFTTGYNTWASQEALVVKNPCQCRRQKRCRVKRSLGQEDPLEETWQAPCLRNPTDRGAWWAGATVHGAVKSRTRLKWLSTHNIQEFRINKTRLKEHKEIQEY